MTLVGNIQREDLNPLETAGAMNRLSTTYNLTQDLQTSLARRQARRSPIIFAYLAAG